MSYAMTAPLQHAVFAALTADAGLVGLVGGAIFDAAPAGDVPPLYVRLGEEDVRDASDGSGAGAVHRFRIAVVSDAPGLRLSAMPPDLPMPSRWRPRSVIFCTTPILG